MTALVGAALLLAGAAIALAACRMPGARHRRASGTARSVGLALTSRKRRGLALARRGPASAHARIQEGATQ